jgi:hypothetical protein
VLAADVTLGEPMEDYWRLYAIPNLERNTRDAYRQQWAKHVHTRVGGYRLRQLSAKVINRELVEPMRRRRGCGDDPQGACRTAVDPLVRGRRGALGAQPGRPRREALGPARS